MSGLPRLSGPGFARPGTVNRTVTTSPVPESGADSSISPAKSSTTRPTIDSPRPLPDEALPGMRVEALQRACVASRSDPGAVRR